MQLFVKDSAPLSSLGGTKMKKTLSLILCLCLAASLLMGASSSSARRAEAPDRCGMDLRFSSAF